MNKEKIIQEYTENFKYVLDNADFERITGYSKAGDISAVTSCAAVLTILNNLTEEVKKS